MSRRFGADLHWFVPLGVKSWMQSAGCKTITELDWWGEAQIADKPDVTFACVPAQHWCKRTATDTDKVELILKGY